MLNNNISFGHQSQHQSKQNLLDDQRENLARKKVCVSQKLKNVASLTDDKFYRMMHLVDKKRMKVLKNKLKSFKIFNGMVVHDMRGPVTSLTIVL
jgi:hypothetical protein